MSICKECKWCCSCIGSAPDGRWLACERFKQSTMGQLNKDRPVNDLISRKQAIKAIEDLQDCYNGFSDTYDKACIIGVLEELPSVDQTGRWLWVDGVRCSRCNYKLQTTGLPSYCPNCGASMVNKFEEPEINPCQGCADYDGQGGCISKGGCGARMVNENE